MSKCRKKIGLVIVNVNREVFVIFAQVPDFTTGLLEFELTIIIP
jgi:hypothetical protein